MAALFHHYYLDARGHAPPDPDPAHFEHLSFFCADPALRLKGDGIGASPRAMTDCANKRSLKRASSARASMTSRNSGRAKAAREMMMRAMCPAEATRMTAMMTRLNSARDRGYRPQSR